MQSLDESSKSSIDLNLARLVWQYMRLKHCSVKWLNHGFTCYVAAAQGFKTDAIFNLCTTGWVDVMHECQVEPVPYYALP